jgi:hypothetical protein
VAYKGWKNSNEGIEGTQKGFAHGSKEVAKARRGSSDFFWLIRDALISSFLIFSFLWFINMLVPVDDADTYDQSPSIHTYLSIWYNLVMTLYLYLRPNQIGRPDANIVGLRMEQLG